jgi:hypothetical protein
MVIIHYYNIRHCSQTSITFVVKYYWIQIFSFHLEPLHTYRNASSKVFHWNDPTPRSSYLKKELIKGLDLVHPLLKNSRSRDLRI